MVVNDDRATGIHLCIDGSSYDSHSSNSAVLLMTSVVFRLYTGAERSADQPDEVPDQHTARKRGDCRRSRYLGMPGSPYFGLGIRTPFESAAGYHLRMMYYHGRETKNGQDWEHGERLVALGPSAVPELVDAVAWGFNPRYDPKPIDMLAYFPDAAHGELARRIQLLDAKETAHSPDVVRRGDFLFQRANLAMALILVSSDWTYLDRWLADARELAARGDGLNAGDNSGQMMRAMLAALPENEPAPEPFDSIDPIGVKINPAFLKWWQENGPRIVAAENRDGFRKARGWR